MPRSIHYTSSQNAELEVVVEGGEPHRLKAQLDLYVVLTTGEDVGRGYKLVAAPPYKPPGPINDTVRNLLVALASNRPDPDPTDSDSQLGMWSVVVDALDHLRQSADNEVMTIVTPAGRILATIDWGAMTVVLPPTQS